MPTMKAVQISKANGPFELVERDLPAPGPGQIRIKVEACGICHSDAFVKAGAFPGLVLPRIPGHEIAGRIDAVGAGVSTWKKGDRAGVGWHGGHCFTCTACRRGLFINCEKAQVTGISFDGGYAEYAVVPHAAAARIPETLDAADAGPLLCAGVTTYSPMKHWGVKKGDKVGIIGFGGLGDMAAKLARAMGADVVVFTRTKDKLDEAGRLGIEVVLENDAAAMKALKSSFDFMLSTIPEKHDINPFVALLKRDRTICVVGALEPLAPINNMGMAPHRKSVAGSLIGNLADTQEVLDFCAEHGIGPDIQVIAIHDINDAYKKVEHGDVRFRFVIDMASLKAEA